METYVFVFIFNPVLRLLSFSFLPAVLMSTLWFYPPTQRLFMWWTTVLISDCVVGSEFKPSRNIIVCITRNPVQCVCLRPIPPWWWIRTTQSRYLPTYREDPPARQRRWKQNRILLPPSLHAEKKPHLGRELFEFRVLLPEMESSHRIVYLRYVCFSMHDFIVCKKAALLRRQSWWIPNIKQILYLCGTRPAYESARRQRWKIMFDDVSLAWIYVYVCISWWVWGGRSVTNGVWCRSTTATLEMGSNGTTETENDWTGCLFGMQGICSILGKSNAGINCLLVWEVYIFTNDLGDFREDDVIHMNWIEFLVWRWSAWLGLKVSEAVNLMVSIEE